MKRILIALAFVCFSIGVWAGLAWPVCAQEATSATIQEDSAAEAEKLKLVLEMHKLRPVSDQVDNAIDRIAQDYPRESREVFILAMRKALNYKAIEKASIEAMMQTFTTKELEVMVDYYSKPEAQSVAKKMDNYLLAVQPTIIRLLDKAMMEIKMGE